MSFWREDDAIDCRAIDCRGVLYIPPAVLFKAILAAVLRLEHLLEGETLRRVAVFR
jgi:hypothetical protein